MKYSKGEKVQCVKDYINATSLHEFFFEKGEYYTIEDAYYSENRDAIVYVVKCIWNQLDTVIIEEIFYIHFESLGEKRRRIIESI